MKTLKRIGNSLFIILASIALSISSYYAGYYSRTIQTQCDPFQIINDSPLKPYPNIDELLKKTN